MTIPLEFSKIQPHLKEAGQIALRYYQTQLVRRRKEDYSPVTEADEAIEKFLIGKIQELYPDPIYEIMGEEGGGTWQGKEFAWAIDPIDGTRVFIDGMSTWAISVGLLRNGEAYRGAVYLPVLDELYITNDDGAAYWSSPFTQGNPRPLQGLMRTTWDRDSFMSVPSSCHRYFEIDFSRLRALGAIAVHHVYVTKGVAIAALHRRAALWDVAGAQAILTAVGGVAVYLDGRPISLAESLTQGKPIEAMLVGHPGVVAQLLPKIKLKSAPLSETS